MVVAQEKTEKGSSLFNLKSLATISNQQNCEITCLTFFILKNDKTKPFHGISVVNGRRKTFAIRGSKRFLMKIFRY